MSNEAPNWVYGTKSSFAAGELTPTIEGRVDLPLYQSGAKKIINWMILPSGGLTRRPGTEFIWGRSQGSGASPSTSRQARSSGQGPGKKISLLDLSVIGEDGPALFDYGILDKEDTLYADLHGDTSQQENKDSK
jgi:hypothetical protein